MADDGILESDGDDPFFDCEEDAECWHCGGTGMRECSHLMECTRPHNKFGECRCSSCNGSGLAKDMTLW